MKAGPRGDVSPVLVPAEEALDLILVAIKPLATAGFLESSAAVRNDRQTSSD